MAVGLLAETKLCQPWVAHHEVASNEGHLYRLLPLAVELGTGTALGGLIEIGTLFAVGLSPLERFFILHGVKYPALNAAHDLCHVHTLDAHAEPFFPEGSVHNTARYAHAGATNAEIGFAAHNGHG